MLSAHRFRIASLAAAAVGALAATAAARPPEPAMSEVDADIDIAIENRANESALDLIYIFSPEAIDRVDPVHPTLRRFVRHPSALFARIHHLGASDSTSDTSGSVGGVLHQFDGRLYGQGEIGYELDGVSNAGEDGYYTLPARVELGGRPLPLLSLGAFWDTRHIINATTSDVGLLNALRSGDEQRYGGTATFATADDLLFVTASADYHAADWTFTQFHPGVTTIRGAEAHLRVAFQPTPTLTFQLRADVARDHWNDRRANDGDVNWIGSRLDRVVYIASGTFDLLYWYKGRIGFRFSLGGGYTDPPPVLNALRHGAAKFGFGLITRF